MLVVNRAVLVDDFGAERAQRLHVRRLLVQVARLVEPLEPAETVGEGVYGA